MTVGILTEKPSAARNFATALGGSPSAMRGTYKGVDYMIVSALGHLYEFREISDMVPKNKKAKYKSWDIDKLPWDVTDVSFTYAPKAGAGKVISKARSVLTMVSEIVIASDIDPTGEGDLLAWEIIDQLGLHDKKISRMEFTDEAAPSLQKAFVARRPVTSMLDEGDYRKALFRAKFDLLSMQWTRVATKCAQSSGRNAGVLRNGRLKSGMVVLVGDQLEKYNSYKRVPTYSNRFIDDAGVLYTNPNEPQYPTKAKVPTGTYSPSTVVADGTKPGKTIPPKLLDLSGLSALLSKKGYNASSVLATYQKMYEAQVVSYPRTEDKFVTPEQFNELLPLVPDIAALVGVSMTKLTRMTPRSTHVKTGGAHGANRPGPNVPSSLDDVSSTYGALGREIYEILAKNYLRMLAGDYTFVTHKGHIKDYPDFVGSVRVEDDPGWRGIFDDDDADGADDMGTGLGSTAKPTIHESVPPRPPHPTMDWLMKQLDRQDIGTGATRTSTFSDVTKKPGPKAPWHELIRMSKNGRLTLSSAGEVNYHLIRDTHIGDVGITKVVHGLMNEIRDGKKVDTDALGIVAQWVRDDIITMKNNVQNLDQEVGKDIMDAERFNGVWEGQEVSVKRVFSGHRFTDDEVESLLRGESVTSTFRSNRTNNDYTASVKLANKVFTNDAGKEINYVGYDVEFGERPGYFKTVFGGREVSVKKVYRGEEFTEDQIAKLSAGEEIVIERTSKAGSQYKLKGKLANCSFVNAEGKTINYVGFDGEFVK